MGLIEQLIILAKEAIDEANQRGRPQQPAPRRQPPEEPDDDLDIDEQENESLRRIMAHRAALALREKQLAEQEALQEQAELARQREAQERERERELQRQRQRQAEAARAAQVGVVDPRRIARLVRHPNALREMVVLREILDKPLALRKPR